jgi:tetratricopeptide (TPR) repeat protein
MFRFAVLSAMLAVTALAQSAGAPKSAAGAPTPAADPEEAWKLLITDALNAATSGNYPKSEQELQQAVQSAARFGPEDGRLGTTVNTLGLVYRAEKKYPDAERAYLRALDVLEKAYGPGSIDVANVNFNIANVMFDQGRQSMALPYIQKALPVYQRLLGPDNLKTAALLCMTGDIHRLEKNYAAAEGPLRRCADIRESKGGLQDPELAGALHSLALVYVGLGRYALADQRFTLAEKIREKTLGITSPLLAQTMEDHAAVLKQLGRDRDAERLDKMAQAIRTSQKNK